MDKLREIYLRRCELFLEPGHFTAGNIHHHLFEKRKDDAVKLAVWSVPMAGDHLPPPFVDAIKQEYRPAHLGDRFGPSWSTHWFRVEITIPSSEGWGGEEVVLRWQTGCEALIWSSSGVPLQGLSSERSEFLLTPSAKDGETFLLYIEMACNTMFGNGQGSIIAPPSDQVYYTLNVAEIAIVNKPVRRLLADLRILVDIARHLPRNQHQTEKALTIANKAVDKIDLTKLVSSVKEAQHLIDEYFKCTGAPSRFAASAIGHCHIDTAWLWRYRETRRKAARSWATQLRLMERYPEYKFVCPQMAQLEWVKQDYPELFKQIKARQKEGRFIPIGGSWVEMDGNMPSGESYVRHLLYGQAFMKENFGEESRVFWLPDTFGYNGQLPQLIKLAGMPYFMTQKLSWSNINRFPHNTFRWEGIDGTSVLVHFPPADTYTSAASINDIARTETHHQDLGLCDSGMLVFGHGDGGGGPTEEMLDRLGRVQDLHGLPLIKMEDPAEFFDRINGEDLPVWKGSLYLELHRGTLTSQGKIKYYNRRCEGLLREAELISAIASVLNHKVNYPQAELERLWKDLLVNQFHDVLPGTSIEAVYHDVSKIYQDIEFSASRIRELAIRSLFGLSGLSGPYGLNPQQSDKQEVDPAIVFFNPVPFTRSDVVVVPFDPDPNSPQPGVLAVVNVPGLSMTSLETRSTKDVHGVSIGTGSSGFTLENRFIKARVDNFGRLTSVIEKGSGREAVPAGSFCNSFWLYDDKPNSWDAWDIEVFYEGTGHCLDTQATVEIGMQGPILATLVRKVKISSRSTITQIISLSSVSPVVEFYCSIDWFETHKLLRVLFPVSVMSDQATFECPFGQVQMPTHRNTSWDAAKFEACAHRYVDLSEPSFGVALLNDCKYGHSVLKNVIGLSLLRAPKSPDATCDMSRHIVRFGLFPHAGTCEQACVVGEAYKFNNPLRWTSAPPASYDPAWLDHPFLSFCSASSVPLVIDTIKKPESGSGLIVRAYEPYGNRGTAKLVCHPILSIQSMHLCDLLERQQSPVSDMTVEFKPFQIITLHIDLQLRSLI